MWQSRGNHAAITRKSRGNCVAIAWQLRGNCVAITIPPRLVPQESKRFQAIDKNWEKLMAKALETRNVVQYCHGNDMLLEMLPHMLEQLEVCQKALSGYLDQKRAAFPRFYFVSDANLLEVLSQAANPAAIQPHLQSVFAAITRMGFDPVQKSKITHLYDGAGEMIVLERPIGKTNGMRTHAPEPTRLSPRA
jgi:hypothetical protein